MSKNNRSFEIEFNYDGVEELQLMQPLMAAAMQSMQMVASQPLQLPSDGMERLRMKQMELPLMMQQMQLQLEQVKLQQRQLPPPQLQYDESDDPQDRRRVNGNGAAKNRR